jgi:hypothetical protein
MKTNLFFVACCVLLLQRSQAQSGFPTVLQLLFDQVASDYNTCNEKGMPMGFVSGFVVDGDAAFLAKQGIEIMFNPQMGVKREGCDLMRWDPVLLAWGRFEGNSLRNAREGGSLYWSSKVNAWRICVAQGSEGRWQHNPAIAQGLSRGEVEVCAAECGYCL